jgi:hypothetical protein
VGMHLGPHPAVDDMSEVGVSILHGVAQSSSRKPARPRGPSLVSLAQRNQYYSLCCRRTAYAPFLFKIKPRAFPVEGRSTGMVAQGCIVQIHSNPLDLMTNSEGDPCVPVSLVVQIRRLRTMAACSAKCLPKQGALYKCIPVCAVGLTSCILRCRKNRSVRDRCNGCLPPQDLVCEKATHSAAHTLGCFNSIAIESSKYLRQPCRSRTCRATARRHSGALWTAVGQPRVTPHISLACAHSRFDSRQWTRADDGRSAPRKSMGSHCPSESRSMPPTSPTWP